MAKLFLYIGFFFFTTLSFGQEDLLAKNYFEKGEFEKSLKTYQQLLEKEKNNSEYFYGVVASYQQLENFEASRELLQERLDNTANNPSVLIEMGYNYELQRDTNTATKYYNQAIQAIEEKPNFAFSIARAFEKYNLLDQAVLAYKKGMQVNPELNFNLPLARIYGEQGNLDEMFDNYLDMIDANPQIFATINREFARYVTDDISAAANQSLRKKLLLRLQKNPELHYNEMLSWLFIQQKEFDKAFAQEKAIYKQNNQDLQRIIQLTMIARNEGDLEAAKNVISFIIEETTSANIVLQAQQLLLEMKIETASNNDYPSIVTNFENLFEQFGMGIETLPLQIDYANFLAFNTGNIEEALQILKSLSEKTTNDVEEAQVKMVLADVLVMDEKFNQALIYYSQIQDLVKNNEIAQTARFKVAKTSYFKGDFDWAQTQLDVLKSSTSQLIANDAMELSLLIRDNIQDDSLHIALKLYAKADLLDFQEKNTEAIAILSSILENHKGEKIEDEALLKQAQLFEETGEFQKAEANYLKIIEFFSNDILADNALYYLATLYQNKLNKPDLAQKYFETIIFNHADSIYFVDARKNFRKLRGDAIE